MATRFRPTEYTGVYHITPTGNYMAQISVSKAIRELVPGVNLGVNIELGLAPTARDGAHRRDKMLFYLFGDSAEIALPELMDDDVKSEIRGTPSFAELVLRLNPPRSSACPYLGVCIVAAGQKLGVKGPSVKTGQENTTIIRISKGEPHAAEIAAAISDVARLFAVPRGKLRANTNFSTSFYQGLEGTTLAPVATIARNVGAVWEADGKDGRGFRVGSAGSLLRSRLQEAAGDLSVVVPALEKFVRGKVPPAVLTTVVAASEAYRAAPAVAVPRQRLPTLLAPQPSAAAALDALTAELKEGGEGEGAQPRGYYMPTSNGSFHSDSYWDPTYWPDERGLWLSDTHGYNCLSPEQMQQMWALFDELGIGFTEEEEAEIAALHDGFEDIWGLEEYMQTPASVDPPTHLGEEAVAAWAAWTQRELAALPHYMDLLMGRLENLARLDPQALRNASGKFTDNIGRMLLKRGYIDGQGSTLRNFESFHDWLKGEKPALLKKRPRSALGDCGNSGNGAGPISSGSGGAPHPLQKQLPLKRPAPDAGFEKTAAGAPAVPTLPPAAFKFTAADPGLDKTYFPGGELAVMNEFMLCAWRTLRERNLQKLHWQDLESWMGPDGLPSLTRIQQAYDALGHQFNDHMEQLSKMPGLQGWFVSNMAALRDICKSRGERSLPLSSKPTAPPPAAPQVHPSPLQPAERRHLRDTAADWDELGGVMAQLHRRMAGNASLIDDAHAKAVMRAAAAAGPAMLDGFSEGAMKGMAAAAFAGASDAVSRANLQQQLGLGSAAAAPPPAAGIASFDASQFALGGGGGAAAAAAAEMDTSGLTEDARAHIESSPLMFGLITPSAAIGSDINAAAAAAFAATGAVTFELPPLAMPHGADALDKYSSPFSTGATPSAAARAQMADAAFVERWSTLGPGMAECAAAAYAGAGTWDAVDAALDARDPTKSAAAAATAASAADAVLKRLERLEASITASMKREVHLTRCNQWNLMVSLAKKQNMEDWLLDTLGVQWRAMLAAHPDGKIFGDHRQPPDLHDPLLLRGIYDDDVYGKMGFTRTQVFQAALELGCVFTNMGTEAEIGWTFLDNIWRMWGPALESDEFRNLLPFPQTNVCLTDTHRVVPPAELTEADKASVQERADLIDWETENQVRLCDTYHNVPEGYLL